MRALVDRWIGGWQENREWGAAGNLKLTREEVIVV